MGKNFENVLRPLIVLLHSLINIMVFLAPLSRRDVLVSDAPNFISLRILF